MAGDNPKTEGMPIWDCRPQTGLCPMNCSECFYNRPNAFYCPIYEPTLPSPEEVKDDVVRMNCGHDSNLQKPLVLETAKRYRHVFFNTSIPKFDFPGPVVLTANRCEEVGFYRPQSDWDLSNLMFVRLRTSATNLALIKEAVEAWTACGIPVVLTFMAYYSKQPEVPAEVEQAVGHPCYTWRKRTLNDYWCATPAFMKWVMLQFVENPLVRMCGTPESNKCRDCRNCWDLYWPAAAKLSPPMRYRQVEDESGGCVGAMGCCCPGAAGPTSASNTAGPIATPRLPSGRPPLRLLPYAEAVNLLTDPLYVALSADQSRFFDHVIKRVTGSPYSHAMLLSPGDPSSEPLLSESTWPESDVVKLSDRLSIPQGYFGPQSGLLDIYRIKSAMNWAKAWDWSVRCAGEGYSLQDNVFIYLARFLGLPLHVPADSDDPVGIKRDCSCQVHAALRQGGLAPLWTADWPYDAMVAPGDLSSLAHPDVFEYVCTPTWP